MADVSKPIPPSVDKAELLRVLENELHGTEALLEVLAEESQSLAGNAEGLARSAGRKMELVAQLEQLHRARCTLLQTAGMAPDRGSMEQLLRLLDDPDLTDCWRRLHQAVGRCRSANLNNGALVELSREHTRRALDILRGAPTSTLYSAAGTHQDSGPGRVLAKA